MNVFASNAQQAKHKICLLEIAYLAHQDVKNATSKVSAYDATEAMFLTAVAAVNPAQKEPSSDQADVYNALLIANDATVLNNAKNVSNPPCL